jgi:transposase
MGKSIIDFSSVTTVGLDLAKHVFQVHCVDASGCVVLNRSVRRNRLLEFSLPCRGPLLGSRPAVRRIIGYAN